MLSRRKSGGTLGYQPIVRVESSRPQAGEAVAELRARLGERIQDLGGLVVFCSSHYDPEQLAAALLTAFPCPVVGCTTAGEIGNRYSEGGLLAIGFAASDFTFHSLELPRLTHHHPRQVALQAEGLLERLGQRSAFGLLLIDGLSTMEEQIVAMLHRQLQGLPLIGGSAGDGLRFQTTRVLCQGQLQADAATLTVIESSLPFELLRLQHFEPSEKDLVITRSDTRHRRVFEIDGAPAAQRFAQLLGLEVAELSPSTFSLYPLMLQLGDEWYVRSVQKVNPDGSLTFFCAIDDGLPLTIARRVGLVETFEAAVANLERHFSRIHLTLGADCILRRVEIQELDLHARIEPLLQRLAFAGFSSYGEQFNSLHVNQTLTAVVLGEKA